MLAPEFLVIYTNVQRTAWSKGLRNCKKPFPGVRSFTDKKSHPSLLEKRRPDMKTSRGDPQAALWLLCGVFALTLPFLLAPVSFGGDAVNADKAWDLVKTKVLKNDTDKKIVYIAPKFLKAG